MRELAAWQQLPRRFTDTRTQLQQIGMKAQERAKAAGLALVVATQRNVQNTERDYAAVNPLVGDVLALAQAGKVDVVKAARAVAGMSGVKGAQRTNEAATAQAATLVLSPQERTALLATQPKGVGIPTWLAVVGVAIGAYAFIRSRGRRSRW